jgi:hypothetical protein
MKRRLPAGLIDAALVLVFALCLWAPWDRAAGSAPPTANMMWLTLPLALARGGMHLETVTVTFTIGAVSICALGALLAVGGRMRGAAGLWAAGLFLFAASVAILMQPGTAAGFLGGVLLLLALRVRLAPPGALPPLAAILRELWPLAYAAAFALLARRYEPRLLVQALTISLGISLVARAILPEHRVASAAASPQSVGDARERRP